MRVFVYYNLHKRVWSVKALEGENRGLVIDHLTSLALTNCTFRVSNAGRQRVIRERCKNVHAGITGYLHNDLVDPMAITVTYNPYLYETFVQVENKQPCYHADRVWFDEKIVRALHPR